VAVTLDAKLIARSARGKRRFAARDFFQGAMATALAPDELLAETRLAILPADTRFGFEEFSRRPAIMHWRWRWPCCAIEGGVIAAPRIGVGGGRGDAAPHRSGRSGGIRAAAWRGCLS